MRVPWLHAAAAGAAWALGTEPPISLCFSYARDKPRFGDPLDAVKFICKEFWNEVFSKQVDNLKTNYRVRKAAA